MTGVDTHVISSSTHTRTRTHAHAHTHTHTHTQSASCATHGETLGQEMGMSGVHVEKPSSSSVQRWPGSTVQSPLQPSLLYRLPSSASTGTMVSKRSERHSRCKIMVVAQLRGGHTESRPLSLSLSHTHTLSIFTLEHMGGGTDRSIHPGRQHHHHSGCQQGTTRRSKGAPRSQQGFGLSGASWLWTAVLLSLIAGKESCVHNGTEVARVWFACSVFKPLGLVQSTAVNF